MWPAPYLLAIWLVLPLLFSPSAFAANYSTRVAGPVNWNANGSWSTAGCGGATAGAAYPGSTNTADTATICPGNTITLTAAPTFTIASLTFNGGATGANLNVNAGIVLTMTGNVVMNAPTTGGITSTFALGSGTINATNITINGNAGGGAHTCILSVSTGTITTTGSITLAGTAANARLISTGASMINIGGNLTTGGTLTTSGTGTINFNGGAAQTMGAYATYNNVTINNTAGGVSPDGNLTVGRTLDVNNGTFTVQTGTVTIAAAGTLNVGSSGIVNVAGTNLTVNGMTSISGTIDQTNAGGNAVFVGLVTVNNGGTWLDTAGESVIFRGGITNNGSFTAGAGAYTFNTNNQAIGGSNPVTIPSATVTGVTLTNNGTLTVSTALTGTGGLTNSAARTLNIGGTSTITTLTATAASNTVNYYGVAQAAKATITLPFQVRAPRHSQPPPLSITCFP